MTMAMQSAAPQQRSAALRYVLPAMASLLCAGFFALGTWQVQRLHWKRDLIARVEQRVHAEPDYAPAMAHWPQVTAAADEYRHVLLNGVFLHELTTRVQAVTDLGSGYWLLTPLCQADGSAVLVNRGFIAQQAGKQVPEPHHADANACQSASASGPPVSVTGLLRISEPGGGFLRKNDAAHGHWYSRDVAAISSALGLAQVAPYFVDADAGQSAAAQTFELSPTASHPVGGMTVISFPNNHLVYAVTWYGLAIMAAAAGWWVARDDRRRKQATR